MNTECKACPNARNCLNGMYCTVLGRYVQYGRTAGCTINGQRTTNDKEG